MNKNGIPIYFFSTKRDCKNLVPAIKQKYNIKFECIDCKGIDKCLVKARKYLKFKGSD